MTQTKKLEETHRLKLELLNEKMQRIKMQTELAKQATAQLLQQHKDVTAEYTALCALVKDTYQLVATDHVDLTTGIITPSETPPSPP